MADIPVYKPYTHEGSQGFYDDSSGEFLPVDAGWKPYQHEGTDGLYNSSTGEFFPASVKSGTLKEKAYDFAKDVAKQVPMAGAGIAENLNAGMANVANLGRDVVAPIEDVANNLFDRSAQEINQAPSISEFFHRAGKDYGSQAEYWAQKQQEMGGNTDPVTQFTGQLIGGALPGAIEWTGGKTLAGLKGAVEASEKGENPIVGGLKGAAERGVMGGIFHSLSPYSRPIRMAGMGGTMGVEAAMNEEPIVPAIGTGLALGAVGGKGIKAKEADMDFWKSVTPMETYQRYKGNPYFDPKFEAKAADPRNIQFWEARRGIGKEEIAEAKREYDTYKEAEHINNALNRSRQEPGAVLAPQTQLWIESSLKQGDFAGVDRLRPVMENEMQQRLKELVDRNMKEQGESITPEERIAFTKLALDNAAFVTPTIEQKASRPIDEKPVSALPYKKPEIPYTIEEWLKVNPPTEKPSGEFDFLKGNQSKFLKDEYVFLKEVPRGPEKNATPQEIRKNGVMKSIWDKLVNFVEPGAGLKTRNEWMLARGESKGIGMDKAKDFVDLLNKRFGKETKTDLAAVFDQINGHLPYNSLSQHQKYISNRIRTIDDIVGRQLVEEGLLTQDTYYRMQGKHIKFLYDIYNYDTGLRGAKLNPSSIKQRQNLSAEERLARGFNKDPLKAISLSILEGRKNVEMSKYFTKLLGNEEIVYQDGLVKIGGRKMGIDSAKEELARYTELDSRTMTPEMLARKQEIEAAIAHNEAKNAKPSSEFRQLKGTRYGDLNGAYIQKDVYHDIVPILDFSQKTAHTGLDMMREWSIIANSLWKTKTVALNLPTLMRNLVFSNPIQMNMSGVPITKVPVYFGKAVKSLITKDWQYTALRDRGAFATNWTMGDLADLAEMVKSTGKVNHPMEKMINLMTWSGKLYGKVDDVWKLAKFIEQLEKQKFSGGEYGKAKMDKAFLEAQKWVMDYSLLDKTVRAARAYPLGAPFIVYQYKILPLLLETLKERPWVVAKYFLIPALMQAYATKDMTPEEAKNFDKNLPQNIRDGQTTILPIKEKDEQGRDIYQSLDMSAMTPWGNIFTMLNHVKDGNFREAAKTTGAMSGLAPQVLVGLMMNRDPYTGREVISPFEAGDPKLALLARLDWMNRVMSPGMLTDMGAMGKIQEWLDFAKTQRGMPLSWYNAVPRLGGININPIDPRASRTEMAGKLKELSKSFTSTAIKMKQQDNEGGAYGGLMPSEQYMRDSFKEQVRKLRDEYKGD